MQDLICPFCNNHLKNMYRSIYMYGCAECISNVSFDDNIKYSKFTVQTETSWTSIIENNVCATKFHYMDHINCMMLIKHVGKTDAFDFNHKFKINFSENNITSKNIKNILNKINMCIVLQ